MTPERISELRNQAGLNPDDACELLDALEETRADAAALQSRIQVVEHERNEANYREHEAATQMRGCHEILDRLGAPRNQDNGLNYHLNGRLSRLIANETGKLWAAEMQVMETLLRRAKAVIPDDYEDEIQVRSDIAAYFNAHQG